MSDMMAERVLVEDEADEVLLWVLVWSELAAFGILIATFLVSSLLEPQAFAAGQRHLRPDLAGLNTLLLLTSGWQAALAARRGASLKQQRRGLLLAALLGFLFVAIKIHEYGMEIAFAGDPAYGAFFELYFILTGFHLLHVVFLGLVLLLVAWRQRPANIMLATTLWHVVDLVWIVMFPILYLV